MAVLWVHEGYQKEFSRKINDYTAELSDIKSQYSKAYSQVSSYSSDSHISSCNTFLQKRQKDLQNAINKANNLKSHADSYASTVISADKRVSDSIHKRAYSFYKSKGIGPQSDNIIARGWNAITTTASDFWHDACSTAEKIVNGIKEFYDEYKYVFNVLFDILAVSAAVALFALSGGTLLGIICAVGATWATAKATYELITDCAAVEAWMEGDIARAEDLSNRTLAGDIVKAGEWLDGQLGTHFFETTFKVILVGLEVCQFVATVMLVWEQFREIFNLKVRSDGKPLKILDHRVKLTSQQRQVGWTMFKLGGTEGMGARFASMTNWLKFGAWELKLSFSKDAKSFTEFTVSLFENRKKNSARIKAIISDPKVILETMPGVPETTDFWNASQEILAM